MTTLVVLSGLPGSGKTTCARQIQADARKRAGRPGTVVIVSRDALREHALGLTMIAGDQILDRGGEAVVTALESVMVEAALVAPGVEMVVIDATHLTPKSVDRWRTVAARHDARVKVITLDAPIEECIRRDAVRADGGGRYVGEDVIWSMAARSTPTYGAI